jgi:hypothetical protein
MSKMNQGKSIREIAEAEVRQEAAEKAKSQMKQLLRERSAAVAVLAGIDLKIADFEREIADGTV